MQSLTAIIDIVEERSIESANPCYFLIVHINYDWVRSLSANLKSVDSLGFDVDFNSSSNILVPKGSNSVEDLVK